MIQCRKSWQGSILCVPGKWRGPRASNIFGAVSKIGSQEFVDFQLQAVESGREMLVLEGSGAYPSAASSCSTRRSSCRGRKDGRAQVLCPCDQEPPISSSASLGGCGSGPGLNITEYESFDSLEGALLASIAGSIRLIGISIAIFFGTEIKFDMDLSGGDQLTEPTRGKGKGKGKWERQWGKAAKAREASKRH